MRKKPEKPKIGRPAIKAGEESVVVTFKAPAGDVEAWRELAEAEGVAFSVWVRRACEKEAKRLKKR